MLSHLHQSSVHLLITIRRYAQHSAVFLNFPMMYTYDFQIANLLIRVTGPFELNNFFELSAFSIEHNPDTPPDALYALEFLPEDWIIKGNKVAEGPHSAVYEWQNQLHRYFHWSVHSKDRFILVCSNQNEISRHTIYLQREFAQRILPQFHLSAFLAPEALLLGYNAFFLHAALINWNGKGILFTGPSGIGKSTQADLWAQIEGAEIINGDRAIIRHQNDSYIAWGSPYAGTSGIYKNLGTPIAAIVVLSQGDDNILRPLTALAAFQNILQEATTAPWDPQFMARLTDLILNLAEQIPIYHLSCTPTQEAVEILKKKLQS